MSQPATAIVEFKDLSKGLLTFAPETAVPEGHYVDCQNMILTAKAPITIGGLTKFNTTTVPDGTIVWFEPHTSKAGVTVMVVATDTGRMYKYLFATDTWTELRRDFTNGELEWCSVPFRGQLIIANSAPDAIMKYDSLQTRLQPVGSQMISDFEDAALWTNGADETTNIREGLHAMKYSHVGASTITASRGITTTDLLAGLNGAPDFSDTDLIKIQFYTSDATKLPSSAAKQSDLRNEDTYDYIHLNSTSYEKGAQFSAVADYSVRKVSLDIYKGGSPPGNVYIEIHTDAAGLPSGTVIANGTSSSIAAATLPVGFGTATDFSFPVAPALVSGTVYHLVVRGTWTPDGVNYVVIRLTGATATLGAANTLGAPGTWAEYGHQFKFDIYDTGAAALTAKIMADASNYFSGTFNAVLVNGWNRLSLARSAFITTGSPTWSGITRLELTTVSSGSVDIAYDDWYIIYLNSPPAGKFLEMYAQQLCVAGIPDDPVLLKYSDAGTIDYFSPDQEARFSGGRHALEKTDAITALFSYYDELIVGKVNSAWTFSGTGVNVSISALPLTIGIDDYHAVAETPWSIQYLFENNIFGARLTSRGLVSTNISSLLANISNTQDLVNAAEAIRHDRTHTVRWTFRTTAANPSNQNDLGLLYDYILDSWACRYTPKIRWMTRAIVDGNRELLCAQYDGYIRRMDVGTTFDGTAIESYVTMPWIQHPGAEKDGHVARWYNATVYLKGTANVALDVRFADEPHEFASAAFTTFGTVQTTPDGDKGFAYLGRTSRWMQLRLRATSGSFEVCPPIIIGTAPTERRV